ncbi:DOPA 4,5-dioxygenase family protein [Mesorhizobium sp.]|uniref:DOPA 4,5-dioxygenase family protein n=1 Tax=Mesorhizobium sp. TaxID=1871066 RepID=UPI0025BC0326|nr:DOPA 4,5-dioxygenase family protein [Mesorhizobium sp.]
MRLGNWRDEPVGLDGQAMYQVSFATEVFATLVPWLMLNHFLIYPNTTKWDHLIDPIWIGRALGVHGEVLGEEDEAGFEYGADAGGVRGRRIRIPSV